MYWNSRGAHAGESSAGVVVHLLSRPRQSHLYCDRPVAIAAGDIRAREVVFERVEGLVAATVRSCCQSPLEISRDDGAYAASR